MLINTVIKKDEYGYFAYALMLYVESLNKNKFIITNKN